MSKNVTNMKPPDPAGVSTGVVTETVRCPPPTLCVMTRTTRPAHPAHPVVFCVIARLMYGIINMLVHGKEELNVELLLLVLKVCLQ